MTSLFTSLFTLVLCVSHIAHDIRDRTELVRHCFSQNCDSTVWNLRCMWCSISWYASGWNFIKFCCLLWKLYAKNFGGSLTMAHRVYLCVYAFDWLIDWLSRCMCCCAVKYGRPTYTGSKNRTSVIFSNGFNKYSSISTILVQMIRSRTRYQRSSAQSFRRFIGLRCVFCNIYIQNLRPSGVLFSKETVCKKIQIALSPPLLKVVVTVTYTYKVAPMTDVCCCTRSSRSSAATLPTPSNRTLFLQMSLWCSRV